MNTPLTPVLYLASRSPRRRALLKQLGLAHRVLVADVDETPQPEETPEAHVRRLARLKATLGEQRVRQRGLPGLPVLGADTVVVHQGRILGKPRDPAEAAAMLALLSGRQHRVLTAVAVAFEGKLQVAVSATCVVFRRLSAAEIEAYVKTGEPMDKAGAYAIQGLAAVFVRRIEGSYSGVMGLPLFETARLLRKFGIVIP